MSAIDDEDDERDVEALAHMTLEVPLDRRRGRLSLTKNAQMMLIRKRTRRWHAALAGAVAGGLAIMWEKKSRRTVISQQMFVRYVVSYACLFPASWPGYVSRGLQGSYNAFTTKRNIRVPNGDVLVFSLAYVLFMSRPARAYIRLPEDAAKFCMLSFSDQIPYLDHIPAGQCLPAYPRNCFLTVRFQDPASFQSPLRMRSNES